MNSLFHWGVKVNQGREVKPNGMLRVCSFVMLHVRIRISDPRSLGSWCTKEGDESTLEKGSFVSFDAL